MSTSVCLNPFYCFSDGENCKDDYFFFETICDIPDDYKSRETVFINDTTRSVCKFLCSTTYAETCSSFLFDRPTLSCILSPYTADADKHNKTCGDTNKEFYRRKRCLGRYIEYIGLKEKIKGSVVYRTVCGIWHLGIN